MRITDDIPTHADLGRDPEPPGVRFRLLKPDDPRHERFAHRVDAALDLALTRPRVPAPRHSERRNLVRKPR